MSSVDNFISDMLDSSSETTIKSNTHLERKEKIIFHQKSENKNLVYQTTHPYVMKSHGSTIPAGLYNSLVKEILTTTDYTVEEFQGNNLIRTGSQGNYGGFSDLIVDEKPSIRFGSIFLSQKGKNETTKNCTTQNNNSRLQQGSNLQQGSHVTLSFYDNITNTIKISSFFDDDILSQSYTIISRENIKEVIYSNDALHRSLTTMGVKPIKVKNTDLMGYLSLKKPKTENYQSNMLALDNNLINQCNLIELVDIFEFKTVQGKRLFSTMLRGPLVDKDEIIRKQKIVSFLAEHDTSKVQELLPFYPDLIKVVKRVENGRISLNDIIFVFQVLQRKDAMYSAISELMTQNKTHPQDLFKESEEVAEKNEEENNQEENHTVSQRILYEEVVQALEIISFNSLLNQINELIDTEAGTLRCTTENIRNIIISRNDLFEQRDEEVKRISEIINKKIKVENFTVKISKKDYNQKLFEKYCFVERSVLKQGVIFTTKKLSNLEKKENELREAEIREEKKIIIFLVESIRENVNGIMAFNTIIAMIDCYCGISNRLNDPDWSLPVILTRQESTHDKNMENGQEKSSSESFSSSDRFFARNAFHPLVKQCIKNDIDFSFTVLTGPNTAGKSTFLKTIAIITILGQIGCAVPAEKCEFILRKGIFMRAGAHDMYGYSTFMLEMIDIARIVKNAGPDSLVLIDELGRGTSTLDGLSLCITIKEYLKNVRSLTIFATHFNNEPLFFEGVTEFICAETVENLITYKMKEGIAESLGIEVAKKVNFPKEVIEAAERYMLLK